MPDLTPEEVEQITKLFGYVPEPEPLEAMLAAVAETKSRAVKTALEAEVKWLNEAHGNASTEVYGERYLSGFKNAAGWVAFHAATPEVFQHLKGPTDD